jgi:hypothetical protein
MDAAYTTAEAIRATVLRGSGYGISNTSISALINQERINLYADDGPLGGVSPEFFHFLSLSGNKIKLILVLWRC